MKAYRILLAAVLIVACATIFAPNTKADSWDHKSFITFLEPVEIPGQILPAGTYEFKLLIPSMHVAQVANVDETKIYGVYFTMTADRIGSDDLNMAVRLETRPETNVKRVVGWFAADETMGEEFVYYRFKPVTIEMPVETINEVR